MKKLSISIFTVITVLMFGLLSCEKTATVEPATPVEAETAALKNLEIGTDSYEYTSSQNGMRIIVVKDDDSKAIDYDRRWYSDNDDCSGNGNECRVAKIDGEAVIIVKASALD